MNIGSGKDIVTKESERSRLTHDCYLEDESGDSGDFGGVIGECESLKGVRNPSHDCMETL